MVSYIPKIILFTTIEIMFINPRKLIAIRLAPAGGDDMVESSVWSTIGRTPIGMMVTPNLWVDKETERRRPLLFPAVIIKRTREALFRAEANICLERVIAIARLSLPRFWRSRLIDLIMTRLLLVLKVKRVRDPLQDAINAMRTDVRETLNALITPLANAFNLRKFARK